MAKNTTGSGYNKDKAGIWKQRFTTCETRQVDLFEDAKKYYDYMYAVQNTSKIAKWRSKVFVPILASKGWDMISRLSDVVPWFNVTIKNELDIDDETGNFTLQPGVEERQKRIEAKLHSDYNTGQEEPMKLKVLDSLIDSVVPGTGFAYATWCFGEQKNYGRKFDNNGNIVEADKVIVKSTQEGYNDFDPINFFNVFIAPGSPSFYKAPYVIIRGFKPLVDMKKGDIYTNLDKVDTKLKNNQTFQLYNQARNRVMNEKDTTFQDDTVDYVTYYECYERTEKGVQLTTYAEGEDPNSGWVEIRPPSYPYWHNMYPIVPFYCRRKSFSAWGESLFENNRTLQSATNDLFNHYLDNWNLSIDGMIMYEDGTLTNDYVVEPGGEITFTGEPPKQFKFPEPNPQQLTVVMNTLNQGIEAATVPQYLSGVPQSNLDKTQGTAYGIKSITEAATTKIGFFRDNFKQSMKTLGRMWLSNLQQFSDSPSEIRRSVNGKVIPDLVLPSDYQGEMELDIDDDSMTPMSKQEKREMHSQYVQLALLLQKAGVTQYELFKQLSDVPRYNFSEMLDDSAELMSIKDSDRYLLPSDIQLPPAQPQVAFKDTPEGIALSGVASKIDKVEPDVRAQVETLAKLKPSVLATQQVVTDAAEQGVRQGQAMNPNVTQGVENGGNPNGGSKETPKPQRRA